MVLEVRNILVPVDLSEASDRVCKVAADLAQRFAAKITVLFVVEEMDQLRGLNLPSISYDEILPDLEAKARERLATYVDHHLDSTQPVDVHVVHGTAFESILEAARRLPADLIVLGTHGRKGLARAIFGSTAERVIRNSPVPIFTVPVLEEA